MLEVPVLAGSSAYALSETFGWKQGLSKFKKARAFYLVIAVSTVIGLWINFSILILLRQWYMQLLLTQSLRFQFSLRL